MNGGKVKVLVTLCHGNQNKLQLYGSQGRKSGEPCWRETLRARMRNFTKLRPCVTPGTGIKPNSQQWEASLSLSLKISDVISYILEKKFIQRASAGQSGPKLTGTGRNKVQFRDSQGGGFKNCKDVIYGRGPPKGNLCKKKKRNKDLQTKRGFGDPQILTEPSSEQVAKR